MLDVTILIESIVTRIDCGRILFITRSSDEMLSVESRYSRVREQSLIQSFTIISTFFNDYDYEWYRFGITTNQTTNNDEYDTKANI